jgi:UDP-N-acetylmuramoyl-L-alanyl-D-glutamate--2,6-diaminopimelate ligase
MAASASAATVITGLSCDSRSLDPGDLFVALAGTRTDGSGFIEQALAAGAAAVLCSDSAAAALDVDIPAIAVGDVHKACGVVASAFYGQPSKRMTMLAVTGTNGKSTTACILESILSAAGQSPGLIGTVSTRCADFERPSPMTTPAAVDLHAILDEMQQAGCRAVAMEVSSHALSQSRVAGCSFDAAVFTNLSRDHLDYHGDQESYFAAKASLFSDYLAVGGVAIINNDDPRADDLKDYCRGRDLWTYSTEPGGEGRARVLAASCSMRGTRARLELDGRGLDIETSLLGRTNLANILAAATTACAIGIEDTAIARGIGACVGVPGRMEVVSARGPLVVVDYAHTPDALACSLESLRELNPAGRVIVVFGCGGDRDRGKRMQMGSVVAGLADVAVVTSDNPRGEEPADIIAAIETGMVAMDKVDMDAALEIFGSGHSGGYTLEPDRRSAIALALEIAAVGDLVLVAGKGHEDYQEVGGLRIPFNERDLCRRLAEAG